MMPRFVVASVSGFRTHNGHARPGVTFHVFDLDYMRVVALFRSEEHSHRAPGHGSSQIGHAEAQRRARALAHELNVLDEAA